MALVPRLSLGTADCAVADDKAHNTNLAPVSIGQKVATKLMRGHPTLLRVTTAEREARAIITIEGQLSSDYVEVIEASCAEAQSTGKQVDLFLRDVATIDEAGRALLRRLAAKGVRLRGKGVYTSYLLRMLCPAGTQEPDTAVTNRMSDRDPTEQEL